MARAQLRAAASTRATPASWRDGLYFDAPRIAWLAAVISFGGLWPALAGNGAVTYTYDALGRIATASYDTNVIVIYTYDANGNRTAQTINVNTATLAWASSGSCPGNCWGASLW